jgi:hypothetical protein
MGTFEYKHVFENICSLCLILFIYLFNDTALTAVYFDHKCQYCETELSESFPCWSDLPKFVRTRIEIIMPPERK